MWSIALLPCSYTDGATIIGELISSLHLPVYTDEMLFSDVSEQFGIQREKIKKVLSTQSPMLHRHMVEKEKYINCLKCSLDMLMMSSNNGRLHYGLHSSLLDTLKNPVLKVLVIDDEKRRVKRAMQQEGFTEKAAEEHIRRHDAKVSDWTDFLLHKEAYDHSLYDIVIPLKNRSPLDISLEIIKIFTEVRDVLMPVQTHNAHSVEENQPYG